jgi:hypothetical protein
MGIPYKVCRSILIWIFENKDLHKVLSTLDILGQLGTLSYILIFTFPNVPEIVQPAFFRKIQGGPEKNEQILNNHHLKIFHSF